MRHLEITRPARTATGRARNAGEAAQHLAHITRERLRLGQERKALVARIQKIDARLVALSALEDRLLPMMRKEADRAKGAQTPPQPPAPSAPLTRAAVPPAPARQAVPPPVPPRQVASPPAPAQRTAPPPAPPVRRTAALPVGLSEVTLQY
jgi:hypothetical protein